MLQKFQDEFEKKIKLIKSVETFKQSDPMIKLIMELGRLLFQKKIDTIGAETLMEYGGKALGAYAYLGLKANEARARRDAAEETLEEIEKELMLLLIGDEDMTITEAKARSRLQLKDAVLDLILKEQEKNNFEHITKAAEKMTSFIQSILRQKQSDKFGGEMYDQ